MALRSDAVTSGVVTRRRQRQRLFWLLVKSAALGVVYVLSLGAAYRVGTSQSEIELERRTQDFEAERAANQELTARLARAEQRLEQQPLPAAVPTVVIPRSRTPDLERLARVAEAKLGEGVVADRLVKAMELLKRERACEPAAETKRLTVVVDEARGPVPQSFAGGKLTVAARGVAARNANGRAESWFDPAQPVEIVVTRAGQPAGTATSKTSGTLPLRHAAVIERREHAFELKPGDRRGSIDATLRICDYP